MFELVNSYIDSLALFLAILFIQGMSFRKIRQYRPNWFQNGNRRFFLSILLGVYYGLAGIILSMKVHMNIILLFIRICGF